MDLFAYQDGRLRVEDLAVDAIADRVDTPLFVYSAATITNHISGFRSAFAPVKPVICFAVKSCSNPAILRLVSEAGCGFDVVSGGELERAWSVGSDLQQVVFAGVGKTEREIRAALSGEHSLVLGDPRFDARPDLVSRGPVGCFNIESEQEFERVARIAQELGVRAHAALRVNPDVDPHTHEYTTTGRRINKFGVNIEHAVDFFARYGRDDWLRLEGLHVHIGSPVYRIESFTESATAIARLIRDLEAAGFGIRHVDMGGGIGADYAPGQTPSYEQYAQGLLPILGPLHARGIEIRFEPGRTFVANAGVLVVRVQYVKSGHGRKIVVCDAGMNALLRPALYQATHMIWPVCCDPLQARWARQAGVPPDGLWRCDVVGPICETSDFLGRDVLLPPVQQGDLLAVFTSGAYGMSMASTYNDHPLPAEVLVRDRSATLIRSHQSVGDLIRSDYVRMPIELENTKAGNV